MRIEAEMLLNSGNSFFKAIMSRLVGHESMLNILNIFS